jgi:arylsulfatase
LPEITPHPNVVVIMADQLRADCVGCYGNPVIRTPHIDALAASGVRFAQTFAQHPQCAPSRAALMTGRYPHANGAISNHTGMAENEVTLGEFFQAAGYRSIGVGKLHLFDQKEKTSFTDTMQSGGQNSDAIAPDCLHEDYKRWLKAHGYWEDAIKAYAIHDTKTYWDDFQANVNPIPAEAFIDTWVGDRAVDFISNQPAEDPFFMFVGLPNPHTPFDCPEPYASMYHPDEMPVPATFGLDLANKPPIHAGFKQGGRPVNYEHLDEPRLRQAMAYYYGAVTLVDDQVGKIMAALDTQGLLDNTVVAFCSDHGELLGHFGMLTKSIDEYPMLYDVGLHIPMIIRAPGGRPGKIVTDPIELIDLCPTLLSCAELEVAPEIQGHNLHAALTNGAPPPRKYIFAESGAVKMLRGDPYKLVYYPEQSYGELYDLVADPHERHNLYHEPQHQATRDRMIRDLLDRLIHTEAPRHAASKRGAAYWRYLYHRPFEGNNG